MKHETHIIEKLGNETQSGNEIWPVYVILQNENFYQKSLLKMCLANYFQALFNFQRILSKKDPVEVIMMIWTKFDGFAITYLT